MPKRAPRPCVIQGCSELVRVGAYCTTHQPEIKRTHVDDRVSASKRGYGATWRRLRAIVLRRNPLCIDPFGVHGAAIEIATDVDHIIPRVEGGQDVINNLQSLCHACHSRKTISQTNFGRGRADRISTDSKP
jgi:5-methylcytosine-specific restriction enzyme A